MSEKWWDEDPGPRSIGVGLALALAGGALGALALATLNWQDEPHTTAADLAHPNLAGIADEVDQFAIDYFAGTGWVVLGVIGALALAATLPMSSLVNLIARGATFFCAVIASVFIGEVYDLGLGSTGHGPGFWAAFGGFALMGIGGAIGPRRVRTRRGASPAATSTPTPTVTA